MSKRHQQLKRERFYRKQRQCQHEGCSCEGVECVLTDGDGDLKEYFCGEHAHEHGYCRCCSQFWGGVEAFDFSPSGLCPHCKDQVDADFAEPEEEF